MSTRYRVTLTPRISYEAYGTPWDISDHVRKDSLGTITRSVDAGNYNIGIYTFPDVKLVADNSLGIFGDEKDSRSLFPYFRDLCKVKIEILDPDYPGYHTTFDGLIHDEATQLNNSTDDISFQVLGRDSVLRKATVPPGVITTGMTFQNAIIAIIGSDEISRVLDIGSVAVAYNGTIDVGTKFDGRIKKDALNDLLFVSNSILTVSADDKIYVKSRAHNSVKTPLALYGRGDLYGRENIFSLDEYNTGLQRTFNSIQVNTQLVYDLPSQNSYGLRHKKFSFDFITNPATELAIANSLLAQWKIPKVECKVTINTRVAKTYDLLDRVKVDHPLRKVLSGKFFPITEATYTDDPDSTTPHEYGAIVIDPTIGFKIIEIQENTKEFTSTLKLRQIGTTTSDGYL